MVRHILLRKLIMKAAETSMGFITITLPADLPGSKNDTPDAPIKFFRSCDFRQIGSSPYFAFARHRDHPSYNLPAIEDFDPLKTTCTSQDLSVHKVLNRYPTSDAASQKELANFLKTTPLPLLHGAQSTARATTPSTSHRPPESPSAHPSLLKTAKSSSITATTTTNPPSKL
jgi:hypothetical protein